MEEGRVREYNHICTCDWCGETFSASRYDAKFCTPAHRAKMHRAELKRSKQSERIKSAIASYLDDAPLEVVDALINDICVYAEGWRVQVLG